MKQQGVVLLIISLSLLGCNYTLIKDSSAEDNLRLSLSEQKMSELSYAVLNQKVFSAKCVFCHDSSSKINLESYPDIIRNRDLVKKAVFQEKTMPKRGSLTQEELSYLWSWLKIGAPEQAQNGNTEPIAEELLLPTYESINKHIFQISCNECHSPSGTGKRIMLDRVSLMNSPLELIIPGNPDESGLVISLERSDDKRMPPAKEGYVALKNEKKAAIRKWIENGAQD